MKLHKLILRREAEKLDKDAGSRSDSKLKLADSESEYASYDIRNLSIKNTTPHWDSHQSGQCGREFDSELSI